MAEQDMSELSDLKGDVRVLKSVVENGQKETSRRLDKIEGKIDAQANVPVAVFEEFKKEVKDDFVTKDQFKPVISDVAFLKKVLYTIVGLAVTALITAGLERIL